MKTANDHLFASAFTDAKLAEQVTKEKLKGVFRWAKNLGGWLAWDGRVWVIESAEPLVIETVRQWVINKLNETVDAMKTGKADADAVGRWTGVMSRNRLTSIVALAGNIEGILTKADAFDADPDLLNTPSGIVDLRTGELQPHDPNRLCTKITKGRYVPGFTHPDWETALTALPTESAEWFQAFCGQGVTGHHTPGGLVPILQGGGENGKSLLTTDGLVPALGDYATPASPKLLSTKDEHSTEFAGLRGVRLLVAEEMVEGSRLPITTIKRIQDVGVITAHYMHKDNISFNASHTLMATTNPIPVVTETDHATWRRLGLIKFTRTYLKPPRGAGPDWEPEGRNERRGDPDLKGRIKNGQAQADAIVTWAVEGARAYYRDGAAALAVPKRVELDTDAWRKDSDRILGLWDELLIPDPTACALKSEVFGVFNQWLRAHRQADWGEALFGGRFGSHKITKQAGVRAGKTRNHKSLSRPPGAYLMARETTVPKLANVWLGVRFRTDEDPLPPESDEWVNEPTTSQNNGFDLGDPGGVLNPQEIPHGAVLYPDPDHLDHKIHNSASNGSSQDHLNGSSLPLNGVVVPVGFSRSVETLRAWLSAESWDDFESLPNPWANAPTARTPN